MLDLAGLVVFAGALFVAAASPGPAIAAIVARVLGRGTDGAAAFTAGIALGDVVWLTFAVVGLAVLAKTFGTVFLVLRYAGAAYLACLAWRMWTAPAMPADGGPLPRRESRARLFAGGLMLTLGNPKVIVFYLALLPSIVDLSGLTAFGYAELVGVICGVLATVFGGYILLASRARRLFASPRALRALNRGGGAVMAGAALAVAAR